MLSFKDVRMLHGLSHAADRDPTAAAGTWSSPRAVGSSSEVWMPHMVSRAPSPLLNDGVYGSKAAGQLRLARICADRGRS